MLSRDKANNAAIRDMTSSEFEAYAERKECGKIIVKAGEGVIMPGNMIHRVYTVERSVAIGCNFLTRPQMETAISTWNYEKTKVQQKMHKDISMRDLQDSNIFINFEAIAMIWLYKEIAKLRRCINQNTGARVKRLLKLFDEFEKTPRTLRGLSTPLTGAEIW